MALSLFKRSIIILPLIWIAFAQCFFGDPRTRLGIYNNRSDNISVYYKYHVFDEVGISEKKLDIKSGKMSGIGDTGLYAPLSKTVNYLIIKDSNGTEFMNLRGSGLDEVVKLVSKDKHHITYRLDVCDTPTGLCESSQTNDE